MVVEQKQICCKCKTELLLKCFSTYDTKCEVKHQSTCNRCSSNYIPRQTGFQKLDAWVQTQIMNDLESGVPKKHIAHLYSIHYTNLLYWIKQGQLAHKVFD